MTHTIYAVTLSLFTMVNHAYTAEQPSTEKPSQDQKQKWEDDAQKFADIAAAMGGKMLHSSEKKQEITKQSKLKINDATGYSIRPKL